MRIIAMLMCCLLAPLALHAGADAHGESQWNIYLNYDFFFSLKYPAYVNRIEEHGNRNSGRWPVSPIYEWNAQHKLLQIFFEFGDSAANMTTSPMWITVYSNSDHTDLKSSADSIMRPYTIPGLHIHFDTCSVAGKNAILVETWDGWDGKTRTDFLETYIVQHRDVVIALTIRPFDFISGRGDTLGLGGDKKQFVLRSFKWF